MIGLWTFNGENSQLLPCDMYSVAGAGGVRGMGGEEVLGSFSNEVATDQQEETDERRQPASEGLRSLTWEL